MSDKPRNYYCNYKFRFLKIDLSSDTVYNCHAATPHNIDCESNNSLFNDDINVAERTMMLNNGRNVSCEQNCWVAEDKGAESPRIWQGGEVKTHTDIFTTPEKIDLTISKDCNLMCTYCCKEFSSTWFNDIKKNGEYTYSNASMDLINRNSITSRELNISKVKQNEIKSNENYQYVMTEVIKISHSLDKLIISGGEPFVNNGLFEILDNIKMSLSSKIIIYTGLGVSMHRFKRYVDKIKKINGNVTIRISAENIHDNLEFNRSGLKWADFDGKINYLKEHNVHFDFNTTLSNLSIFGFSDFYKLFGNYDIRTTLVYTPSMMAIYVLDQESKNRIVDDAKELPTDIQRMIVSSIHPTPTNAQRIQIKEFLLEFTKRNPKLSLGIFPSSFLKWIGI